MTHWVATLVVAAGDLGTRGKVLSKLIELADVLSDKLGNLVSFMAIMEGLSLPQVLLYFGFGTEFCLLFYSLCNSKRKLAGIGP